MVMRITENMKFNTIVGNIFNLQNKSQTLLEQLASQKKINRPSDDPRGTTNVLGLYATRTSLGQYKENIAFGENWLKITETNLQGVDNLLGQAREVALQSQGATASDMTIAANHVQSIIDQVVDLANAKFGDQYLFAGSMADTQPYTENSASPPPYVYNGNNESLSINIGQNASMGYTITGDSVFAPNNGMDIFNALSNLKTALENNDKDAVQSAFADLDGASGQVQVAVGKTGTMLARLDFADNHLTDLSNKMADMIYNAESVDLAQLAADINIKQVALTATFSVASQLSKNTIMDFLK